MARVAESVLTGGAGCSSPNARTVENHVRSIMDKLGFTSRTQIATWVTLTNSMAGDS
jgi:hypothetical protein